MRITILSLLIIAVLAGTQIKAQGPSSAKEGCNLMFQGQVLEIGPPPTHGSGGLTAYQIVKYKVIHLCEGIYDKKACAEDFDNKELEVEHVLLVPDELKNLKVGDIVCIQAYKSTRVATRYDEVLHKYYDRTETYFLTRDVFIRNCQCER